MKACRLVGLVLLWWVALLPLAWAGDMATVLDRSDAATQIDRGVELLIESPGESITPAEALSQGMANRWHANKSRTVQLPRQPGAVWVRVELVNRGTAARWVLSLDSPYVTGADFHQVDPATQAIVAGESKRAGRSPGDGLAKDVIPAFAFTLDPGQRTSVLVRVSGARPLFIPLVVREHAAHIHQRYDSNLLDGWLFGILCVMLLYNLSLYVFTRDASYGLYTVYTSSVVANDLVLTGFGPLYLWSSSPWWLLHAPEVLNAFSFLCGAFFLRRFLRLHKERHLRWICDGAIVSWSLLLAWSTAPGVFGSSAMFEVFATPVVLVSCLATLYAVYYLSFRGDVLARYVAIAWTVLMVSVIFFGLSISGVIDSGWWTAHFVTMGYAVETTLLSIALAARIRMQQQRESSLASEIEQEREAKLVAQDQALAVQALANHDLEQRVQNRTVELQRALMTVESTNSQLARLSVTDPLTQINNRRYFDEVLHNEFVRALRTGSSFALLMIDIDHFKHINDKFGHVAGDECLRQVAAALRLAAGRSTDLVARYGGEEFVMILPDLEGEDAFEVAERARRAVEAIEMNIRHERVPLTVSIGVHAGRIREGQTTADLVAEADSALYTAKREGRNRVRTAIYSTTLM